MLSPEISNEQNFTNSNCDILSSRFQNQTAISTEGMMDASGVPTSCEERKFKDVKTQYLFSQQS